MTRLPAARLLPRTAPGRGALASAVAALALSALPAPPLAAQQQPGTFSLPPSTPSPTPAPAGPADERAGVAIPPRPVTVPTETEQPRPAPTTSASPTAAPPPRESAPPARASAPSPAPASTPAQSAPAPAATGAALPQADATAAPAEPLPVLPEAGSLTDPVQVPETPTEALGASVLPEWWPWAAGGAGALVLLGGAGLIGRRRRARKPLRLAAPVAKPAASDTPPAEAGLPRLDLALDITSATRSVMMFTLEYRLTIANRTDRAVNGLNVALQLACARASAGAGGGAGSAQILTDVARIGPHQGQSLTGTLQLPLSAITPLRQGTTPLFVPLVHVTLEGEGQRALARSFVVGPPSASGRVHPIPLDQPPGGIAGLKAQAIAVPAVSAAA